MVLQGIGELPMQQRAAVEIGAQCQDEADIGAATRCGVGEAGQQHIDEVLTDSVVSDQREGFLELIGDQEDAAALVAAAALGEHVAQRQFARAELLRQLSGIGKSLGCIVTGDVKWHQGTGQCQERVAIQFMTDPEVTKEPSSSAMQTWRETRQDAR